ncbi:hypothetical protein CYMTET_30434 [Cymbomonas tetramitiformis]|uniref:Uncharacterized protein n=1 Tax=Cymbomonas tetramitiformis TaxID=36881 RepID=A0AAE0FKE1_9CHLO|nr:hypothetical protein CYMTET_30434 [Cymbomonas tetramitiformis]
MSTARGNLFQRLKSNASRVNRYLREDFKEIVWPSSIPDPPGYVPRKQRTFAELKAAFPEARKRYWESLGLSEKSDEDRDGDTSGATTGEEARSSLRQELETTVTEVASKGIKGLKPVLQKLYTERAQAYREAIHDFIKGYREGLIAGMERGEAAESSKSSTDLGSAHAEANTASSKSGTDLGSAHAEANTASSKSSTDLGPHAG